ncbi:unnamed protein product [Parnassius apollo]|uniref:(apollo) hypothetical protein n=1 Tax=Parnassius apollo TaxID=110799 RepID=A0A8S3WJW4_PARAO|nr:unnamed protein product [Parnassius apollo]
MNKTPKECKNKWRNLRDNYRKNQNKKKTGSAASVSKYDDERLKFINDSVEERGCISSLNEKCSVLSSSLMQMSSFKSCLQQPSLEGNSVTPQSQGTSQVKNKKRDSLVKKFRKNREERTKMLRQISEQNNTPVHTFFRSMADVVCQFPPDKIAQIRTQVCNIVTEMELSILAQGDTPTP